MTVPVLAVFVPGLMGAGLLVSMALLVADGARKLRPARGQRARALVLATRAHSRRRDFTTVPSGSHPAPVVLPRAPRPRPLSLGLGVLAAAVATLLVWGAVLAYRADGTTLSDRGWTIGGGVVLAALPAAAALVLLASGALGDHRPRWLDRLARAGVLGALPDPPSAFVGQTEGDS